MTSTKNSLQSKTKQNTSSILDVTGKQMLTGSYHTELATQSSTQHYLTELATQSPAGHYLTDPATQSWTIRNYNMSKTTGPYNRTVLAEQDECAFYGTCDFVSKWEPEYHYCHCDSVCNFYDDCCIDYLNYSSKYRLHSDKLRCAPMGRTDNIWFNYGILLTDTCPEFYTNSEIYEKCQQNDNVTKLYVADDKGIVY